MKQSKKKTIDCTPSELFNALTGSTRQNLPFSYAAMHDEIRRFIGTLEYNHVQDFDQACMTARGLIIQESYADMCNNDPVIAWQATGLAWQFTALNILKQIQNEGSSLQNFMRNKTIDQIEERFDVERILELAA